ncbi:hypothetical protein GCM10009601_58410 [Streptomyces thermospinosisporus]|uniref:DUF998 domain-containing protein n=1 Tax=Streptomyces thermospinosisporus TaxID=161482 RepID=A0ABN1Z6G8_9ACTN
MSVRKRRLGVTALAVLAPVLVWVIADPLVGQTLRITDSEETLDVGAVPVAFVALVASLLGWGLLALLERFVAQRARTIWTVVAGAVLLLSFLPLTGGGMDGGTRFSLAVMHLAVAAVLMTGLVGGSSASGAEPPG